MAKTIAFWGKDGSGKSTIASNIAIGLANAGHIVGIVSTNISYGSIQHYFGLNIPEQKSITEAIENFTDIDIKQRFVQHPKQKNLFLLSLANSQHCLYKTEIEDGEETFIENLKSIDAIDYILIDCTDSIYDNLTTVALVSADKVIYVFKPDIQNSSFLSSHTALISNIPNLNCSLSYVCNSNKNYIDLKQLQSAHKISFLTVMPYCSQVEVAASEGDPFINRFSGTFFDKLLGSEQYKFAKGINTLSQFIIKED